MAEENKYVISFFNNSLVTSVLSPTLFKDILNLTEILIKIICMQCTTWPSYIEGLLFEVELISDSKDPSICICVLR